MRATIGRPGRSTQHHVELHGAARDEVVKEIAAILTAAARDGRVAGPKIRQLRKAVHGLVNNKAARTIYDLLNANDRADELADYLRRTFAPESVHAIPLNDALVLEMDVQCAEMPLVARVLSGANTGADLGVLEDELVAARMSLDMAIESVRSERFARRRAS